MFQSLTFHIQEYLGPEQYKLTDSDFESILSVPAHAPVALVGAIKLGVLVATEYAKRGLNVPANLALMYKYAMQLVGCDLNDILKINYIDHPELSKEFYGKYLDDIKKYLLLL